MKYLAGILLVMVGFLLIWKSEVVYRWVGTVEWAEKYLGVGQSRLFIKFLGLIVIIVAFLILTGAIQGILEAVFLPHLPVQ